MRLLPYLFLELAPFYVAKYDAAPEAVSYEHAPFYVTNLAVPSFMSVPKKMSYNVSAYYVAETNAQKSSRNAS
jgi:hypothetical protein